MRKIKPTLARVSPTAFEKEFELGEPARARKPRKSAEYKKYEKTAKEDMKRESEMKAFAEKESKRREMEAKKAGKPVMKSGSGTTWLAHVKKTRQANPGMKFGDVLKLASKSWKK